MSIELLNIDCMEYMRGLPDKAFELAIVDPPYGIGASEMVMGKGKSKQWDASKKWDKSAPDASYFDELKRVSKNQIIWGANHFIDNFPFNCSSPCWIVWDKMRDKDISFADCELAWTSFQGVIKKAPIRYDGFIGSDKTRIHPTQKPVKLYEWLLANYAKEGDRILDTHLGSGSSAIAAHYGGFDFVGCELDNDYYKAACERFDSETKQVSMF